MQFLSCKYTKQKLCIVRLTYYFIKEYLNYNEMLIVFV